MKRSQIELNEIEMFKFNNKYKSVSIYSRYENRGDPFKVTSYGINWSALGTVDVLSTEFFIDKLRAAIALTKKLNESIEV